MSKEGISTMICACPVGTSMKGLVCWGKVFKLLRYAQVKRHWIGGCALLLLAMGSARVRAQSEGAAKPELVLQTAHTSGIGALAFSPDGRWLATADNGHAVKIWDTASGLQVRSIVATAAYVMVFGARGTWLATSYPLENVVNLWQVATGKKIGTLTGHRGAVWSIAVSPDGRWLATGSADKTVGLWDLETGKSAKFFGGFTDSISAVAFSGDSRNLVAACRDQTMKIWEVPSGTERRTVKLLGHADSGKAVAFGPEGNVIVAGLYYNFVKLWNTSNGSEARALSLTGHTSAVQAVALSPDGRRLASAEQGKGIKIWDTSSGHLLKTLKAHPVIADVLAFSPDGGQVAGGYRDVTIKLWDTTGEQEVRTLGGRTYQINSVAFSPDGHWLASASTDDSVKLWDFAGGGELRVLPGHGESAWESAVRFSPDGHWLASASGHSPDNTVRVWEVGTWREKCTLSGEPDIGTALAFSHDGRWLVTGGGFVNRRVRIWELATCRLLQTLSGHGHSVNAAEVSPDDRLLATGSPDDTIRVWEVASGRLVQLINLHTPFIEWLVSSTLRPLAFSPDGKRLASAHSADTNIRVWDVGSWREVLTLRGHQSGINSLAFIHHGEWLASGSFDHTVRLWDAASGAPLRTISLTGDIVFGQVAFSSDENWIASANVDGSTRIWDVATAKERVALIAVGHGQEWVAVAPDGLFDGTADAMQQVAWRTGNTNNVTPLDSFFTDFYYPGLRTESLSKTPPAATVDIATVLQIPGLRTMLELKQAHLETREGQAIVCFEQVPSVAVGSTPGETDLPAEINDFRVVPTDATCKYQKKLPSEGNASDLVTRLQNWKPEVFTTPWDGKSSDTANSTLHVFTVGVGKYPASSGFDELPYAAKSAKGVEDFFTEQKRKDKKVYAQIRVWPGVYDLAATREIIRNKLSEMSKTMGEDDVVLLYLAGHGVVAPGQEMFYFVPVDGRDDQIRDTGMNTAMLAEALREMPARRVVLVIDACQSGGAVEALSKIGEVKARVEERQGQQEGEHRADHEHGVGVYVIAATLPLAYSVQLRKEDQSALAVTLLEGLRQGRGSVGAKELIEYLKQRLPEASEKAVGYRQVPLASSIGLDFKVTADSQ